MRSVNDRGLNPQQASLEALQQRQDQTQKAGKQKNARQLTLYRGRVRLTQARQARARLEARTLAARRMQARLARNRALARARFSMSRNAAKLVSAKRAEAMRRLPTGRADARRPHPAHRNAHRHGHAGHLHGAHAHAHGHAPLGHRHVHDEEGEERRDQGGQGRDDGQDESSPDDEGQQHSGGQHSSGQQEASGQASRKASFRVGAAKGAGAAHGAAVLPDWLSPVFELPDPEQQVEALAAASADVLLNMRDVLLAPAEPGASFDARMHQFNLDLNLAQAGLQPDEDGGRFAVMRQALVDAATARAKPSPQPPDSRLGRFHLLMGLVLLNSARPRGAHALARSQAKGEALCVGALMAAATPRDKS